MYPIHIKGRKGASLTANTLGPKMSEGVYDISTTELTRIAVLSEAKKASAVDAADYTIPANVIVPVFVPAGCYLKADKVCTYFRVNK